MISKEEKEIIRKEFINDLWRQAKFNDLTEMFQNKLKYRLRTIYLDGCNSREQVERYLNGICSGFYACWDTHYMLVQLAMGYNEEVAQNDNKKTTKRG